MFDLLTYAERNATRNLYRMLRTEVTHTLGRREARSMVRRVIVAHVTFAA